MLALGLCFGTGCIEGFDSPSAYEDERYLCEEAGALEAEVDRCENAGSCGGVLSLRGRLDGTELTVTTHFGETVFRQMVVGDTVRLDRIDATGPTPYFNLSFKAKSLGAETAGLMETRVWDFHAGASSLPDELADDSSEVAFRISTLTESVDLVGLTGMGSLELDAVEEGSAAGTFEGSFDVEEDWVEGCFVALATSVRTR